MGDKLKDLKSINEEYIDEEYFSELLNLVQERELALLDSMGENVLLYKRRFNGIRCQEHKLIDLEKSTPENVVLSPIFDNYESENDSSFPSQERCIRCFNTGIVGGYYPFVKIKIRYGGMPEILTVFDNKGMLVHTTFNSWTLAEPALNEHDIIVRENGERYVVQRVKISEWRNVRLHTLMNLDLIQPNDIRYYINNLRINDALEEAKQLGWDLKDWQKPKIK